MYEPKTQDIESKASELLDEWLDDADGLGDALVMNIPAVKALLYAKRDDVQDALLDLKSALEKYAESQRDFYNDAREMLIAEVGYTVRTDVDDYKFFAHDTRC